jgi:KUP system potassium uptake protein
MPKFKDGGYVPVFIAVGMFTIMTTWRRGRAMLADAYKNNQRMELGTFLDVKAEVPELPRAMVFMSSDRLETLHDRVPLVVKRFLRRYGALPRHVTIFSIAYEHDVPYYKGQRYEVHRFAENVVSVRMHVGYMENPDVRAALHELRVTRQIRMHAARWTIVMGHEQVIVVGGPPLVRLQFLFFQSLMRFATQAHVYFGLGDDPGVSKEVVPVRVVRGRGTVITDEGTI